MSMIAIATIDTNTAAMALRLLVCFSEVTVLEVDEDDDVVVEDEEEEAC